MNISEAIARAMETGHPGMTALLGMGTVFTCLVILYAFMSIMNRVLVSTHGKEDGSNSAEPVSDVKKKDTRTCEAESSRSSLDEELAAVMAIAIGRHRSVGPVSVSAPSSEQSSWKIAGRLAGLRTR